ncbi:MAG: hypothetical protein AAB457_00050, partial [Patescibacteria group bacterium]
MRHIIIIRDNQKNQAGFVQVLPLIFLAVAASVTFIIVAKIQTDRVGETRQFAVYPGGSCSGNGDCPSGYSCQRVGGPDERECKLNPEPTQPAPLPTKAPTIAPTPTPTIVGATPQPTVKPTAAPTPTIAPSVAPTPTVPSGPSSFLAGTNIWTPNGLIPIETMQTGDAVYSFDPETQKIDIDYVEKVLTRISDHYYTIRLRDGIELFVTEKHPIYRGAGYRSPYWNEDVAVGTPQYEGFEVVKHLRVGNTIYTFKGPTFKGAAIVSIVRFDSLSVPVFNLVVAGARTYFANGVAVHNKVREKEVASAPTPVPTAAVSALDKLIQNDIRECVKSGGGTLQQCLVQAYGKNAPTSAPKPTPVPRKASAVPTSIPTAVPTPPGRDIVRDDYRVPTPTKAPSTLIIPGGGGRLGELTLPVPEVLQKPLQGIIDRVIGWARRQGATPTTAPTPTPTPESRRSFGDVSATPTPKQATTSGCPANSECLTISEGNGMGTCPAGRNHVGVTCYESNSKGTCCTNREVPPTTNKEDRVKPPVAPTQQSSTSGEQCKIYTGFGVMGNLILGDSCQKKCPNETKIPYFLAGKDTYVCSGNPTPQITAQAPSPPPVIPQRTAGPSVQPCNPGPAATNSCLSCPNGSMEVAVDGKKIFTCVRSTASPVVPGATATIAPPPTAAVTKPPVTAEKTPDQQEQQYLDCMKRKKSLKDCLPILETPTSVVDTGRAGAGVGSTNTGNPGQPSAGTGTPAVTDTVAPAPIATEQVEAPVTPRQVTAGGGCCGSWDCGGNAYCAGAACSGDEGRGVCIKGE